MSPVVVLWPKGPLDFGYQYCLCGSKYLWGLWGSRYLYGLGDSLYSIPASQQKISSLGMEFRGGMLLEAVGPVLDSVILAVGSFSSWVKQKSSV